jgi:hypothetical protein
MDGGTEAWIDEDFNRYFIDNSMGSDTIGQLYDSIRFENKLDASLYYFHPHPYSKFHHP